MFLFVLFLNLELHLHEPTANGPFSDTPMDMPSLSQKKSCKVFLWKKTIENLILLKERIKIEEKNKLKHIVLGGWVPKAKKFFSSIFLFI